MQQHGGWYSQNIMAIKLAAMGERIFIYTHKRKQHKKLLKEISKSLGIYNLKFKKKKDGISVFRND